MFPNLIHAIVAGVMFFPTQTAEKEDPQKLILVLRSSAPLFEKADACRKLTNVGGKEAVPALAELLADEKLNSHARSALELIPDASAGDALREAAGKLKGNLLVGVINSLGVRHDAKAVPLLIQLAGKRDSGVMEPALAALGRIASNEAAEFLRQTLAKDATAADACLLCANRLFSQNQPAQAVLLLEAVRQADVPKNFRNAAIELLILVKQADGVPLFVEKLKSEDQDQFAIALRVARRCKGDDVPLAILKELENLSAAKRAWAILALEDALASAGVATQQRALQIIVKYPSLQALTVAVSCLPHAKVKEDAATATLSLAGALPASDREAVAAAMERLIRANVAADKITRARALLNKDSKNP